MEQYKKPTLRLNTKKKKISVQSPSEDGYKVESGEGTPKTAPINIRLSPPKEGDITYRKGGKAKMNIIHAREVTNESAKEMMEMERLKREKKLKLKLQKMR